METQSTGTTNEPIFPGEPMIFHCPRCQKRVATSNHVGDFVHDCDSGNATLDNEDVPYIGGGSDYTGDITQPTRNVNLQGIGNKLAGTRAGEEGFKSYDYTVRGNRKATHRTRPHQEYINLKDV